MRLSHIATSDLKPGQHIAKVVAKANGVLGFLRRNFSNCPPEVKSRLYQALCRPCLEYATSAWDPWQQGDQTKLEGVQRRAARFCYRDYRWEEGVVTTLLGRLGWESLAERRQKRRLVSYYKITRGGLVVDLPRDLRPNLRPGRQGQFFQLECHSTLYQNSFFPSTIRVWNGLGGAILGQPTLSQFRGELE